MVKTGYGSQNVIGWFDLNGNNNFDVNEQLITLSCATAGTEYSQTFTVPATDIEPGAHRFRLVTKYSSAPTSCNNSSFGQTHDYSFTLPEMYARVQNVVAELDGNNITINWQAPAEGTPTGYNIYRDGTKLNSALLSATTFVEQNVEQGVYAYGVTAVYDGNKESFTEMSNIICNFLPPALCEEPSNLSVSFDEIIIITWSDPLHIDGNLKGFMVYRDDNLLTETMLPAYIHEFKDEEQLPEGTYIYKARAIYGHCDSEFANFQLVIISVKEIKTDAFQLFPNPTKGELNISGKVTPTYVGIYNLMGQTMFETTQCAATMKISVSTLPAGIYFVKIVTENGSVTKKMVVEN
jgi:hypothetical protein